MKVKFEVKLTASKALLTVLAAFLGLANEKVFSQNLESQDNELAPEADLSIESIESKDNVKVPVDIQANVPKKRTRNSQKSVDQQSQPAGEKIIPPAPTEEAETTEAETEETTSGDTPELSVDDIRNYAGQLLQSKPALRDDVMKVLLDHGASKFSEAKPEHYASILAEFKKLG